jgi:hypothetical protein
MSTKIALVTSLEEFEELHRLAGQKRAVDVRVNREALSKLLIDHSVMTRALEGSSSFTLTEPRKVRTRLNGR